MTKVELIDHLKSSSRLPDDWYLMDEKLVRSALYDVLPIRREEVVDYDTFLSGKTVIAYGFTPNEKRWLKRHVEQHHGKFRFTYGEGIDIYIMSSVCSFYDLQLALENYHKEHNIVVVSYDLFTRHFEDYFDDAKEEKIKEEEKRAKANRQPSYEVCTKHELLSQPKVSPSDLSLANDVFHIIGKTDMALREAYETIDYTEENKFRYGHAYDGEFYTINKLYELIKEKGGRYVKKEESPNITCVIYGKEPSKRAVNLLKGMARFISVVDATNWLLGNIKSRPAYEVCSERELEQLPKMSVRDLNLAEDVFHIIGDTENALRDSSVTVIHWPEPSYLYNFDLPYWDNYYSTSQLYELVSKKGGYCEKEENNPNITCVIYGSEPSAQAIKILEGRAKFISAVDAVSWFLAQDTITPACRVFAKSYHASEDIRLRPYQQTMKIDVFRLWDSFYNLMLQLPTGTGKTVLFTSIINDLTSVKETKVLILAHRKELIDQISKHLSRYEIEHGVIASGRARRLELNVQVASVQTLTHEKNIELLKELKPQFIIIDEAHHSLADTYTKFWKHCGDCWKLGVTATPYRLNNKSFKSHFDKLIEAEPIDDFIQVGYLAEYDFMVDNPRSSLSQTIKAIKEKSLTGDYKTATLLKELNVAQHIQRLIVCYEQYVKGKKGIVYAINKEHARNICEAYQVIGVAAVYIDSDTEKRERAEIVEKFVKNEIQVMVNVDIFSEGFDCPDVEFIQLARPTWSLAKYLQQVGRGLRPCIDKQKTVILDNSRMFVKFGLPSEKRSWVWHFSGDSLAKSLYKQENTQNEADLMLVSRYCDEMMFKMNKEEIQKAKELKMLEEAKESARLKAAIEEENRKREERRRKQEEEWLKQQEEKRRLQEEAEQCLAEAKAEEEKKRRQGEEGNGIYKQIQVQLDVLRRETDKLRSEHQKKQAELQESEEQRRRKWEELARQRREEEERRRAYQEREAERKRRQQEQVDRAYKRLYGTPTIKVNNDNDEDDHSERNRKIFAAIATAIVFIILYFTVGLFGIAIIGLIAGGIIKK